MEDGPFIKVIIFTSSGIYYDFAMIPDKRKTKKTLLEYFEGIDEEQAEKILDDFLQDYLAHQQELNSSHLTH